MAAINIKTLGRSSLSGGFAQLWRILSRFILTPVIIGQIGMEGYGVWTLVFSIAAYVDMSNLSLGMAYTKFTAECVRKRQFAELERIVGSGIALIAPLGIIGLAAAWVWGESLLHGLNVPEPLVPDAKIALVVIIGMMFLRMTVGCRLEILSGLQRIDLTFQLYVLASFIEFAVSLPLLLMGHGLLGLAIGHAAGQVTINLAAYSMVRKRLPQVTISPFKASRDGLRKILSVGGRFQLLSMLNTVVQQGVKLLLSWLLGVEWVGIYELADKLIKLGKTASEAVIAPLMPAFASLRAGGDALRERLLFLKGSKADALFGGTAFTFLGLLAPSILLLWTGQDQPWAAWAIRMLALGEATGLLTSIVSSSLRAQGLVGLESARGVMNAALAIALMVVLMPSMGFAGLIWARLVSQLITTAWYLRAYFRFSKISWSEYLEGTRIPVLALLLLAAGIVILGARTLLPPLVPPGISPRWAAVVEVLVWSVPFLGMMGVGTWRLYLTPEDRQQVAVLRQAIARRIRRQRSTELPEVVIVASLDDPDAEPLTEAAETLGRVDTMGPTAAGNFLNSGVSVRLVLVLLQPGEDPKRLWQWMLDHRPDLVTRMAFVSATDDPFYEVHEVRRYAEVPTRERLRADWGEAPPTSGDR